MGLGPRPGLELSTEQRRDSVAHGQGWGSGVRARVYVIVLLVCVCMPGREDMLQPGREDAPGCV